MSVIVATPMENMALLPSATFYALMMMRVKTYVEDFGLTLCIKLVLGFMYSGTQNFFECYCDNSYGTYGSSSACDFACFGDSNDICGGSWALSVYAVELCGRTWFPIKTKEEIVQRVWGGAEANPNSFPWQVNLWTKKKVPCAGTIIARDWILTSAHCARTPLPIVWAVAGDHYLNSREKQFEQEKKIVERIDFAKYNGTFNPSNDIAVYRLETPFEFNDYVQPICMPMEVIPVGTDCTMPGWGLNEAKIDGIDDGKMRQAWFTILTREQCVEYVNHTKLRARPRVYENATCAGGLGNNQAYACAGDSGSGLVYRDKITKTWTIEGVHSGSMSCRNASRGRGNYFTSVDVFRDWIEQTTGLMFPVIHHTVQEPPARPAIVGHSLVLPCPVWDLFDEHERAKIAHVDWRNKSNDIVLASYSPAQGIPLNITVPGFTDEDYTRYKLFGNFFHLWIKRFRDIDRGPKCCDVFVKTGDRAKTSCFEVYLVTRLDQTGLLHEGNTANRLSHDASWLPTSISIPLIVIGCIGVVILMIIPVKAFVTRRNTRNTNNNDTASIVAEIQATSITSKPTMEG